MKIIKQGVPIKLYGECGGCHTVVETDSKEAWKPPGLESKTFKIECPTCGCTFSVYWKFISRGVTYGGEVGSGAS